MAFLKIALLLFLPAIILCLVIYFVPAPAKISLETSFTLLLFFIPLMVFIFSLINLLVKNTYLSLLLASLLILILTLQALKSYLALIILLFLSAILLLFKFLNKPKGRKNSVKGKIKSEPPLPKIKKILG